MAAGSTVDELARLRHLQETQRLLTSADSGTDELLHLVAQRAQAVTAADSAMVELLDGDELVRRASTGSMEGMAGVRLRAATTISGRCVRLGVPMRCADTEYDARVDRADCRQLGIRSMVLVPLMRGEVAVGVLKASSAEPDHFDDSDVEVLQEMAGFIARVVDLPSAPEREGGRRPLLTTLTDRRVLVDRLQEACSSAEQDGMALAVLVVRLQGLGPGQGRLVRLVAETLSQAVRGADFLTRLDEQFVLVCTDTQERDAYGIMARISSAVRRVADSAPEYGQLSASVGVAWRDDECRSPEQLLAAAGAAAVRAG